MTREHERHPLTGLRAVRAPEGLAERVLEAAAKAADTERPEPSVWDRLWHSTPLRVAWVVAVVLLGLAHAMLGGAPERGDSRATVATIDELDDVLSLPPIEISPRAESIALGGRPKRNTNDRPDDDRPSGRIDS